jgi:hypothetical protein
LRFLHHIRRQGEFEPSPFSGFRLGNVKVELITGYRASEVIVFQEIALRNTSIYAYFIARVDDYRRDARRMTLRIQTFDWNAVNAALGHDLAMIKATMRRVARSA